MLELEEGWNQTLETNQIFVLPNGIDSNDPHFNNGSIVLIPKRHEMVLLEEPMFDPKMSFNEKVEKLLLHVIRFPLESDVKINFYVSSWSCAPDNLDTLVESKYLQWFKETVTSIPSVEALRKLLKSKPRKLPMAIINILLWLLVGLREPKLKLIKNEDIKDGNMLVGLRPFGRIMKIYNVESTSLDKISKNELLRYEYGYACERINKVYGYLYHFSAIGNHLFFVNQLEYAFRENYFDFPKWKGAESKAPFCTLLVMEWTPKTARPFIRPYALEIPKVGLPNYYYYHSLAGARLSHVIIVEPKVGNFKIAQELKCLMDDGVALSTFIFMSLVFIAGWFQGRAQPEFR